MTSSRSLLAQLSRRLTSRTEDIAVEALGHILSNSEACRSALRDLLRGCGTDLGTISRVETQSSGASGERPDLAAFDEHRVERLLIEAKFWAGLTGNQPVTYLERLPKDTPSALLVIAPAQRLETIWEELRRRVLKAESIDIGVGQSDSEVRYAAIDSRRLIITSWRNLLTGMATQANAAGDVQTVNDIQQLQSLADQEDSDAFLPLRSEQLGPEFPRLVLHLNQIVEDVCARLFETEWASRGRFQVRQENGYFRYFSLHDKYGVWFGVQYSYWAQYHDTPLWFGFQNSAWGEYESIIMKRLDRFRRKDPTDTFGKEGVIPIHLPVGVEKEAVIEETYKQVECIANLLKPIRY